MGNVTECSTWCGRDQYESHEIPDTLTEEVQQENVNKQQQVQCSHKETFTMINDAEQDDNFECTDFSWEAHKPDQFYATPIPKSLQLFFLPPKIIRIYSQKFKPLNIKVSLQVNSLPLQEEPYLIPSMKRIYVGQWLNGKPYGVGKMVYLETKEDLDQKQQILLEKQIQNKEKKECPELQSENDVEVPVDEQPHHINQEQNLEVHHKQLSPKNNNIICVLIIDQKIKIFFYKIFINYIKIHLKMMSQEIQKQLTHEQIEQYHETHQVVNFYEGEVRNALANGRGRLLTIRLSYYEGYFKDDKFHGEGELKKADGFVYKGQFENHKPHGRGEERHPDKTTYENNFIYNLIKITYVGKYVNGQKTGPGSMRFPLKDRKYIEINLKKTEGDEDLFEGYDGDFCENKFHGDGIYVWPDGRKYEGQFNHGKMEGQGSFTWPNKQKYVGDYFDDQKHGYGKFYWGNGAYWEGNWNYGQMHGLGIIYIPIREPKKDDDDDKKSKKSVSKKKTPQKQAEEEEIKYQEIYGHWEHGEFTTCYLKKRLKGPLISDFNIMGNMTNMAGNLAGGVTNIAGNVAGGVTNMAGNVAGGMTNIAGNVVGGVSNVTGRVSNLAGSLNNNVIGGFQQGLNLIKINQKKEINLDEQQIQDMNQNQNEDKKFENVTQEQNILQDYLHMDIQQQEPSKQEIQIQEEKKEKNVPKQEIQKQEEKKEIDIPSPIDQNIKEQQQADGKQNEVKKQENMDQKVTTVQQSQQQPENDKTKSEKAQKEEVQNDQIQPQTQQKEDQQASKKNEQISVSQSQDIQAQTNPKQEKEQDEIRDSKAGSMHKYDMIRRPSQQSNQSKKL